MLVKDTVPPADVVPHSAMFSNTQVSGRKTVQFCCVCVCCWIIVAVVLLPDVSESFVVAVVGALAVVVAVKAMQTLCTFNFRVGRSRMSCVALATSIVVLAVQENIICWKNQQNHNLALSFQEKEGCTDAWKLIAKIRGFDLTTEVVVVVGANLGEQPGPKSICVPVGTICLHPTITKENWLDGHTSDDTFAIVIKDDTLTCTRLDTGNTEDGWDMNLRFVCCEPVCEELVKHLVAFKLMNCP
jgi:hypothetical protein